MEPQQIQQQENPLVVKRNPLQDCSNPKKMGISALIMAVISFFIFGYGLSLTAMVFGVFGVYVAVKRKAGVKIILLNVLAIILGLVSNILVNIIPNQ